MTQTTNDADDDPHFIVLYSGISNAK